MARHAYPSLTISKHLIAAAALSASIVLAMPVSAQENGSRMEGIALSSDKPIQIESDKLEVKDQINEAFFTGNVVVVQGTTTLNADSMTVFYRDTSGASVSSSAPSDIKRIEMDNNVKLSSDDQHASGDKGTFEMDTETLTLEGEKVVLSEGENIFVGCRLTVLMKTGIYTLESCGRRVQVQIEPKSAPK